MGWPVPLGLEEGPLPMGGQRVVRVGPRRPLRLALERALPMALESACSLGLETTRAGQPRSSAGV
jgi:hypothetical protein